MAGYILVDIEWTDDEGRARYVDGVLTAVEAYGGEFLASTPDEYAPPHHIREQSANSRFIFFEGA